ncbi:hypothetical protein G7Y89_g7663 [Cudoniella acicularis]|uniref:Uncharacterized protein n=1 Tax=Cudoniella acicularis TaxID=354080 RepID=A0A8H4RKT1_9HELO|nr:hypothetical protein G7Y89_g7663 [Cudoniella acicularis]
MARTTLLAILFLLAALISTVYGSIDPSKPLANYFTNDKERTSYAHVNNGTIYGYCLFEPELPTHAPFFTNSHKSDAKDFCKKNTPQNITLPPYDIKTQKPSCAVIQGPAKLTNFEFCNWDSCAPLTFANPKTLCDEMWSCWDLDKYTYTAAITESRDPGGDAKLAPVGHDVQVKDMEPMCFGLPLSKGEQKDENGDLKHRGGGVQVGDE